MSKNSATTTGGGQDRMVVFQEQSIRRLWHGDEWWFSVIDVVGVLSETANANRYWSDLKRKLAQEAGSPQPYEKIVTLKLPAPDGRQRETDCATTESITNQAFLSGTIQLPSDAQMLQKIANVVRTGRKQIALLGEQTIALAAQKRGLMQKLLTGQWRLPIQEETDA